MSENIAMLRAGDLDAAKVRRCACEAGLEERLASLLLMTSKKQYYWRPK